jgi:N-acetyl-alpha-D-glucosaminyl L-malate synthase BshA
MMDGVHLEFYRARDHVSYGRASNEHVKTPKMSVALSLAGAMIKLRQIVTERDIDVIHAHWAVPMGFVASLVKASTDTPLVTTTHGRDVYVNPEAGAIVPKLWYVRPFLRFALRRADRVIAVSRDCRRHALAAGAPSKSVRVLYNGVDTGRFRPDASNTAEIRHLLGVPESAKLILFVGSLMQYKGVDVLIRAIPVVLDSDPSAMVVIIGTGPQREDLMALRDSLGLHETVILAGFIPNSELADYENACEVLVLPSRRESFGIAALEAMACAKPVIGTRRGGLKETIDHEKTGLLVDPDDPRQLASAILRILNDERLAQYLGASGRRKVEAEFDWVSVANRTVALYREALEDTVGNG